MGYLRKFVFTQLVILIFPTNSIQLQLYDEESKHLKILHQNIPFQLQNCVQVLFAEESKNLNVVNLFSEDKLIISYGNQSIKNLTLSKYSFQPTRPRDIHKFRNPCTLAIIQVSNHNLQSVKLSFETEELYNFLQSLNGILRKDQDNFIFYSVVNSDHKTNSLLHSTFTSGSIASFVKNKIGLQIILQNSQIQSINILTTCFFCGPKNTPKLIETNYITNPSTLQFPDYTNNFHGKLFTVSVATLAGWLSGIQPISEKPGQYKAIRGIFKLNFDHLAQKFNFTGTFFPSTGGGGSGNRYSNGTWAGAVGDVYNGKADIGFPVGIVLKRALILNFAFPVTYDWLAFTTGIPQPHYSWKSIYWPLDSIAWYLTIGSFLITLTAFIFILKFSRNKPHSLNRVTTYLVALFLEQDKGKIDIKDNASRVLISFWLIFGILVTTAYRSKLVSLISFPILEDPPNTFKSLAETAPKDYHITLQYLKGAAFGLLKTSKSPTFMNIFSRMALEENDAKCYQKSVGTIKHACISWANVASYVKNKNLSDASGFAPLVMAPDTSTFVSVSFIFRKEEVFKEKFDGVISRATALGLKEKWVELDNDWVRTERYKWEQRENISRVVYEDEGGGTKALRVENLMGTFFVLCGGFSFGMLVGLGELICRALIK